MTTFSPVLANKLVAEIASDCGFIIDFDNIGVSEKEIDFFVDCVINKMLDIVSENAEDIPSRIVRDLFDEMKKYKSYY